MGNNLHNIKVILYISIWVIIWGTIASLIDLYFFLDKHVYAEGDLGQYMTFSLTALISFFIARNIYSKLKL